MNVVLYTKQRLTLLCKRKKWRKYSKFNKIELLQFVQQHLNLEHKAASRLQHWFRSYVCTLKLVNSTDFVSLEEFEPNQCLFKLREHRQIYRFIPEQLVQSIISTGKFINPYTRTVLSQNSLTRLHKLYIKTSDCGITFKLNGVDKRIDAQTTLIEIQRTLTQELQDLREMERTIEHLVSNCTNIHNQIIEICTNALTEDRDTITTIITHIFGFYFPVLQEYVLDVATFSHYVAINSLILPFIQDAYITATQSDLHKQIMELYLDHLYVTTEHIRI